MNCPDDDFQASPKEEKDQGPPIEIPVSSLSADALKGIVDSFIMREGTDYGVEEVSFEKKVQNLLRKIEKEEIRLVFDPNTESVTFLTEREWKKFIASK